MSASRHQRCPVVKKSRLKRRRCGIYFPLFLIAAIVGGGRAATIFFSSLQSCNEQCVDRNLAVPLPGGSTGWAGVSLADCDFDCRIQACRVGCQDLEAFNSTCDAKCDAASGVRSVDSCRQGCRAVADIFLHQIQYLLNHVTVEIVYDALQGIRLSWSFEDAYANTLQEIAAANLRWVAQSRPGCTDPFMALPGWKWTHLDSKAFKDSSNMQFTVYVPFEGVSDIQVRLGIIWRDTVAVSPIFSQSLLLSADDDVLDRNGGVTRRRNRIRRLAFGQLQWSADGYVVCWHSERERILHDHESAARRFRLRVFHTSGAAAAAEEEEEEEQVQSERMSSDDAQRHHDGEAQSTMTMMAAKDDDHVNARNTENGRLPGGDDSGSEPLMTRTKSPASDAATDQRISAKRSSPPEERSASFYTTVEERPGGGVIDGMVMLEAPRRRRRRARRSEPPMAAQLMRTEFTGASCYLLRQLPQKRCCRVGITEVDESAMSTTPGESNREAAGAERMVELDDDDLLLDISLSPVTAKEKRNPFIVFTNGRQLLVIENVDDYVMLTEPRVIPFPLPDDVSITALTAISHGQLYVGLSDGSIYALGVTSALHGAMYRSADQHNHQRSAPPDANSTTTNAGPAAPTSERKSAVKREPGGSVVSSAEHLTRIRDADGTSVTQIAADDAQARLYVVRGGGGGLIRCASLTSCGERNATVLSSSASSPNNAINNIAIDAWNGFLYYATTGGDVFSTPLFPQDATGPYTLSITRRLADIPPVFTIEVDSAEQKLIAVLRNGSLLSRDLVDESVRDERADYASNDVFKAVTRSQFYANRLFWVSRSCGDSHPWDTCLHSEEINHSKKKIHLSRYLYGGRVQEFALMRDAHRPTFIAPPSKIGLSIDDTEARLNWKPPASLPFQAPGSAWRALAYEYTFSHVVVTSTASGAGRSFSSSSSNNNDNKDEKSASSLTTVTTVPVASGNVSFINDVFLDIIIDGADDHRQHLHHHHYFHSHHHFHNDELTDARNASSVDGGGGGGGGGSAGRQPAAYVATVRACTRDFAVCSPPLRARNRALRPAAAVRKSVVLFTRPAVSAGASTSSGSTAAAGGGQTSGFLSSLSNSIATSLFMDSVASGGTRYAALNMLGEELSGGGKHISALPHQLPPDVTATIAYDNTTRALYAAGGTEISIFRVLDDGIRYRFLDFLTVNQLCVMPIRASILLATQYSIVSYRLTSSFDRVLYNCAGEECGEVVGLATDDHAETARIYYFLRQRNGTVDLYRRVVGADGGGGEAAQKIYATNEFYAMRQMVLIDDRIVFLTRDGLVGAFDLRFHSWNFNLALRDVAFLLGAEWSTRSNRLQFRTVASGRGGGGADDSIGGGGGAIGYDSTRGELMWRVESPGGGSGSGSSSTWDERGNILYKIQLFRDNFGGDRTVALTAGRRFEIPRSVLDTWASRQKFDVQIDAFNAWTVVSANRTSVTAPTKPPSAPTNLRIYATQQKTLDGTRANIDLFWEEPSEWNGDMLGYVVNCTWENGTQLVHESVSARHSRAYYSFAVKSGRIGCAVAATNEQNLVGAFSDRITIDGSDFRPLIRLFAIDSTDSLVAINNWSIPTPDSASRLLGGGGGGGGGSALSGSLAALTNAPLVSSQQQQQQQEEQRQRRQTTSAASSSQNAYQYQTLAFVGVELYAIRKEADALFLVMLDINDINVVLYKGSLSGDFNGQIEAMTSDWVAYRLLLVANHELMQISLDSLQTASSITPKRLFSLSSGAQDAKQLIFDPFASTAYLLTKNGSLFSLNLNGGAGAELNLALELECLRSQTVTSIVAEFAWNRAASPLIYALTWNGMIAVNTAAIDASSSGKMEVGPPVQLISESGGGGASAKSGGAEMAAGGGGGATAGGTESSAGGVASANSGGDPASTANANDGGARTLPPDGSSANGGTGDGNAAVDATSERQRSSVVSTSTTTTTLRCSDVSVNWTLFGEKGLKAISSFTVADKLFIFFTSTELLIYDHQLALVSPVPIANSPLRQILAASQSSQPYPERSCFALPSPARINFTVRNEGRTGAVIEVDEPSAPYANCPRVSTPQIQYQLQFWRRGTDKVKLKTGYSRVIHVDNGVLDKETDYDVSVYWYNRYSAPPSAAGGIFAPQPPVELPRRAFRTGYGYPSAPLEPFAWPVTPDAVLLNWKLPATLNAPPAEIKYRITQLSSTLLASVPIGVKQLTESGATGGATSGINNAGAAAVTSAGAAAGTTSSSGAGSTSSSSMISDVVACVRDPCRVLIPNLRPSVDYQFWVTAVHVGRLNALSAQLASSSDDAEATSGDASARTKDVPGVLRVEELTSDAALLRWSWLNPHSSPPTRIFVQYRQSGVDASWIELRHTGFDPTATAAAMRNITIDGLRSATTYDFRYAADYAGEYPYGGTTYRFAESFYQQSLQARTKAGTPSAPEDVKIERDGDHWTLRWSPPRSNGGEPIQSYAVEFRPKDSVEWEIVERGLPPIRLEWKIVQRRPLPPDAGADGSADGTSDDITLGIRANSASGSTDVQGGAAKPPPSDTEEHLPPHNADGDASAASDDVTELPDWRETAAAYRVRAANSEGFGGYAVVSATDGDADASSSDASSKGRLGANGSGAAATTFDVADAGASAAADASASRRRFWLYVFLVFSAAICPAASVFVVLRSRNLRRQRAKEKIHKVISLENITNQIQFPASPAHFPPEVENELKNLPQIAVGAVERLSLLGTGSFGEVFEGVAYDPDNLGPKSVRVAVKQLKDDNNDENRIRFLKEAILMNNFDHPNIVKLLGVQRAVKPHFLVIELMEGGELHKFLQASRPHGERASQLSLRELVSMMIDIGRGCAYLESFRHVHRDLATRNCLISSRHSAYRVTKIADFGLAREVSMQDYYRVHGADFLPLRWLAPESVCHGLFTTKSDVWAFGIVVWEIMTLGQQPYPGHSNTEVITRIQAGRAPSRPKECPDEIYEIMRMAWTVDEEKRPRFAELLPKLEAFRSKPHLQTDGPFPPTQRHSALYGGGGGASVYGGVGGAPGAANLAGVGGSELLFGSSQDSSESGANGAANAATTTSCSTTTSGRSAAWNVAAAAASVTWSGSAAADSDSVTSGGGGGGRSWTPNQRFNKSDRSVRQPATAGSLDTGRTASIFSSLSTVQMGGGSPMDGRSESAFSGETMSTTLNDDYEIPRKGFFGGGSNTASTRAGALSSASHSNVDSGQYIHPPFNRARGGSTVVHSNQLGGTPPLSFHALAQRQHAHSSAYHYGNAGYVHDDHEPVAGVSTASAECFNASFPTVCSEGRKSNPPSYYNCYPLERGRIAKSNTVRGGEGDGGRLNPSFEMEPDRNNSTYANHNNNNNDDRRRRRRRSRGGACGGDGDDDDDDESGGGGHGDVNSTDSTSGSSSSNSAGGKVIISEV